MSVPWARGSKVSVCPHTPPAQPFSHEQSEISFQRHQSTHQHVYKKHLTCKLSQAGLSKPGCQQQCWHRVVCKSLESARTLDSSGSEARDRAKGRSKRILVVQSCHELSSNNVTCPKSSCHRNIREIFTSLHPVQWLWAQWGLVLIAHTRTRCAVVAELRWSHGFRSVKRHVYKFCRRFYPTLRFPLRVATWQHCCLWAGFALRNALVMELEACGCLKQ